MKRAVLLMPLLLVALAGAQGAPGKAPSAPNTHTVEGEDPRWEYIVVSFGKTLFSEVSDAKSTGLSKTLVYSAAGLQLGQEALATQSQMDALGRFGWELVAVVGSIGGDQEMVFKRRFDLSRSSREAKLIQDEAKVLAARRAKEAAASEDALIDLDRLDQSKEDADFQANAQAKFTDYAGKAMLSGSKVADVYATYAGGGANQGTLKVRVEVDGTAGLLKDANKYRRSEAARLSEATKKSILDAAGFTTRFGTDTEVTIVVTIDFDGKKIPVATAYGFGPRFLG